MALFKLVKKAAGKIDDKMAGGFLNKIMPLPDVEKAKRVMFIGPHPDDIEIGAGATVDKMIKEGRTVSMLVCTDGGCGLEDSSLTPDIIAQTRFKEAQNAALSLGCDKIENLMFPDGGKYDEWDLAIEIAKRIYEFSPDVIFCPDPNLPSETHPDHLKCGRATNTALFISSYYFVAQRNGLQLDPKKIKHSHVIAYYYTHRANSFVEISDDNVVARERAIKLHKSQMPTLAAMGINLYLSLRDKNMGKLCGAKMAEGFFVLSPIYQHCVSEINEPVGLDPFTPLNTDI